MPDDLAVDDLEVIDNRDANRYEIRLGDDLALVTYRRRGSTIALIHTEVPKALEGHGMAARLAKHALDEARTNGLDVIPFCPYVSAYIGRHPEYADIVATKEQWKAFLSGD